MNDDEVFDVVRNALVWAKAEVVTLDPVHIRRETQLAQPPIYLDSLEFVALVTRLEEELGLVADDEHFSPRSMRTVGDLVEGVKGWIDDEAAS